MAEYKQKGAEARQIASRRKASESVAAVSQQMGVLPPQAVDLEEAVLGALMLEKNAILGIQEILVPESFYREAHQIVYQAILDLSARIEPIDLYTVGQQLQKKGQLAAVGGPAYLAELSQKVGSAAHLEFHAKIVAQKYVQRQLISASTEIQKQSFDDSIDVEELINQAEQAIFQIAEGNIRRDVQSAQDIVSKAMQKIEEASQKPDGLSGIPSGFTDLDRLTLGWQPSDLVIIAARPAMGKTAFVLTMARNISVDYQKPVAVFSLEMSSVQLMMRLIIGESGLDSQKIKNGRLSPDEWKHLEMSIKPLAAAPMFIDDTPALSIYEFRSKVRRLKAQHNIELVIIDYLQLMTVGTTDMRGNREQEVATISRTLKAIAKELDVPILALSQLSRNVESRGGTKRPQLSDLRESGAIEQDADIVAFIHRPEYYGMTMDENNQPTQGLAEIIVAKHRNGAADTIRLRFRSEQAKFVDWDDTGFGGIEAGGAGGYSTIASSGFDSDFDSDGRVVTVQSSGGIAGGSGGGADPFAVAAGTGGFEEEPPF
ncbi:MAG: replicative DNA helicase [Rikenella sp.]|nr:replicative DNA helicase [Rikenella sp.]